jgi:CRP-like cAMP-binding protein
MRSRIPKHQLELLGAVPLFSGCTQGELRSIAQLGTPVAADPGVLLTKRGTAGREFFLVLEGTAACRVGKNEVKRFRTGNYFGELALLHGGIRTADVVAVSHLEMLVFDAREFRAMLMTTPNIGLKMLANLAQRLTDADSQYTN